MEGVWSVQQITLYWTFTTSANIYHRRSVFSPFLTFWSSQLNFLQIADKFWIGANFNQFRPSFSLLLFAICDFLLTKNSLLQIEEGFSFVCVFNEVGYCKTKFCDDLFFVHLTTSQKICWELGFCLLINHSSCRDWITDKYWLTFGFE